MTDPRRDAVAHQYEHWRYPAPIADIGSWLSSHWEWFDPSHAQPVLWPERASRADLDILIAGCGTNQAAVFAYNNRAARVTAIDVSAASLAHQARLKERHGLWNLHLHQLPIEEVARLGQRFDLIVCTGVLHHLADPVAGLTALAPCLRDDGVLGIMLYAKYGRLGVALMEDVFAELGLQQDAASLDVVKRTLAGLPAGHPVRTYLKAAPDLASDAGLVDTFLHRRARNYTVPECLDLVAQAGLAFQGWFMNAPYHAVDLARATSALHEPIAALPAAQGWAIMERIHTGHARHFFMACHAQRERASYIINFKAPAALDDIPCWRLRCGSDAGGVFRPGWRLSLDAAHLPFVHAIDGVRNLRQIMAQATGQVQADPPTLERFARHLFDALWKLDFIAVRRA